MDRRAVPLFLAGCLVSAAILSFVVTHGVHASAQTRTFLAMILPLWLGLLARILGVPLSSAAPAYALTGAAFWLFTVGAPADILAAKGHALMGLYFVLIGALFHRYERS